jgi:hypothetical protein
MFKRPFLNDASPRGDAAEPHEEPTVPLVPWNLFPRRALHPKLMTLISSLTPFVPMFQLLNVYFSGSLPSLLPNGADSPTTPHYNNY